MLMEYLPYILDALIIILPLLAVVEGLIKGFTGLVLPFALVVGMVILARLYAGPMAQHITENFIHDAATERLSSFLSDKLSEGSLTLSQALPSFASEFISSAGYSPDSLISEQAIPQLSESIITAAQPAIIIPAVTAGIYICFYLIAKILGVILVKPTDAIAKLPILKQVNKTLGFVAGILLGGIRCLVLAAATSVVISFAPESAFASAVSKTKILSLLAQEIINLF